MNNATRTNVQHVQRWTSQESSYSTEKSESNSVLSVWNDNTTISFAYIYYYSNVCVDKMKNTILEPLKKERQQLPMMKMMKRTHRINERPHRFMAQPIIIVPVALCPMLFSLSLSLTLPFEYCEHLFIYFIFVALYSFHSFYIWRCQ